MKKIRGILSAIIGIVLTLNMCMSAYATENADYIDLAESLHSDAQILKILGIMDDLGDNTYGADLKISRAEFVTMAVKAMNISPAVGFSQSRFADVSPTNQAYNYLCVAEDMGLISIGNDRCFYPDRSITVAEATAYMIRALNYGVIAESKGGYPVGYISVSTRLNLLPKNISDYGMDLSKSMAVKLITNALLTSVAEPEIYGNDEVTLNLDGKTMLEYYHHISKYRGIVTGTTYTEFNKNQSILSENQIKIGNEIYKTQLDAMPFLGFEVYYFVKDSAGEEEVVYIMTTNRNRAVTIKAEDLQKPAYDKSKGIRYMDDNREKVVSVDSLADLVYNGVAYYDYKSDIFDIEYGEITVIDNDRDNKAEVIFIDEYYSFCVSAHDVNDGVLYSYNGKPVIYGDYDNSIFYDKDGNTMLAEDIEINDVVSVFESKNDRIAKIIVSKQAVEGRVEKTRTENGDNVAVIAEKSYIIDGNCKGITVGVSGAFYLDFKNRIVYYDEKISEEFKYAYAYQGAVETGFDEGGRLKVLNEEGELVILNSVKKGLSWNGNRKNGAGKGYTFKELYNTVLTQDGKFVPQVIKYKLDSNGDLKELHTDAGVDELYDENYLVKGATMSSCVYKSSYKSYGGLYFADSDTVFFVVLRDENGNVIEEDLQSVRVDYFTNDATYSNIEFYDINEVYLSRAAVIDAVSEKTVEARYSFIVDAVERIYEDDENKDAISGWCRGEYVTWPVKESVDVSDIQKGYVLWVARNANGEIFTLGRVFDLATKTALTDGAKLNDNAEITKFYAYYLGTVYAKSGNYFSVDTGSQPLVSNLMSASSYVYVYDRDKRVNVSVEGVNSLVPDKNGNGSVVFVRKNSCATRDIIVIK